MTKIKIKYLLNHSIARMILYRFIFLLLLILSITQHSYAGSKSIESCDGKKIMGRVEKILLMDKKIILDAKLDSGADSSSLSAKNILPFERNHKKWIQFTISSTDQIYTAPLIKNIKILRRSDEITNNHNYLYKLRPTIQLPICVGNQKFLILVNLIDRSTFKYPMLIGNDAIKKMGIIIDVSKSYTLFPKCQ